MIARMARVRLVAPAPLRQPVTEALQEVACVQLEPPSLEEAAEAALQPADDATPGWERRALLVDLLSEVRAACLLSPSDAREALEIDAAALADPGCDVGSFAETIRATAARFRTAAQDLAALREEQSLVSRYERVLHAVGPFLARLSDEPDMDYFALTLLKQGRDPLPALDAILDEVTRGAHELYPVAADAESVILVLVVGRWQAAAVRGLLDAASVSQLRLPSSLADRPLREALPALARRSDDLPREIAGAADALRRLGEEEGPRLAGWRGAIAHAIAQLDAWPTLCRTRWTVVLHGWVPVPWLEGLRAVLQERFRGQVVLEELPFADADRVPVLLLNPRWARPYERLVRLLPLPRYGSVDPTPWVAACFPLFFGAVLGDVGHGLVALAVAAWASRRRRQRAWVRDAARILAAGACVGVIFGLLYGELFGELGEHLGLHPWLVDRRHAAFALLGVALGVGVVHMAVGQGLGVAGALRRGRLRAALAHGLQGMLVLTLPLIAWAPPTAFASGAALLALLWITRGRAVLELLTAGCHVLSYARLMAFAVASAYMAFVANALARQVPDLALGVAVGVVLHLIALVVGVLDPAIQSARLHLVEFFGNFYEPGGRPFAPFGASALEPA